MSNSAWSGGGGGGGGGEDSISRGFECSWVSTTQITVNPGVLHHGTTRVGKIVATTLDVSVAADYWDGASDRGTAKVMHVYCDNLGSIKMSDSAPDCADSVGNTTGQKYYWYDGSKYWRWVWMFYLNSSGSGEISKFMSILGGKAMKYLPSLSVYASTAPNENTWTDVNMASYISTAVSRTIQVGISAVGGDAGSAIAIGVKAKGESGEVNVCYSSISQDIQNEGAMAQTGPAAYAGIGTRVDTQVDSNGVFQYEIAEYSSTSLYGNSYVYLHRIYFDSR